MKEPSKKVGDRLGEAIRICAVLLSVTSVKGSICEYFTGGSEWSHYNNTVPDRPWASMAYMSFQSSFSTSNSIHHSIQESTSLECLTVYTVESEANLSYLSGGCASSSPTKLDRRQLESPLDNAIPCFFISIL